MKRFLKKRFLGIPMVLIASILTTTMVLAAWSVITLPSTGQINVTVYQTWSVSPTALDFDSTSAEVGGTISVTSAVITITNDGVTPISGVAVVVTGVPAGLTATSTFSGTLINQGDTATLTVTLSGPAPGGPATIDLSGIEALLTAS